MATLSNPLESFIWGSGGAKMSPEQVARQREIAAAMMNSGMDYSPVSHWLQGAARASQGLVGGLKDRWANEAETAGRNAYKTEFDSVFGGGSPVAAALAGAEPSTALGAVNAMASIPTGDMAATVRNGLIGRGLPEHIADAFILNMQDESGLNPGINEAAPIVPGSRGGYGLYQLTGPRRTAYEAFAGERGVDPSDVDAQLDFLMSELQGPEARAAEAIFAAQDTPTAAAAIVNQFLRPAEEHRARREAAYLGGSPRTQVAQAGGQPSIAQLIGLAGNEWATPGGNAVVQALLGQQMQQRDPRYQQQLAMGDLDMQRAQLELDALRNPAAPFQPRMLTPEEMAQWGLEGAPGSWVTSESGLPTQLWDGPGSANDPAKEQQIARVMETGVDRNTAINIVDGIWRYDANPLTGQPMITDMVTGQPVHQSQSGSGASASPVMSTMDPEVMARFGTQFPASPQSFGVGGAAAGAINTIGDALGVGAPYPDIQQTQADFGVIGENILNDFAGAYGRQPPSWLLQRIDQLIPKAGDPFTGSEKATQQLQALGRDFVFRLQQAEEALQRDLSPTNRQEQEAIRAGLIAAISRVDGAIQSFGGQSAPSADVPPAPEGVPQDLWQVMTPEERALWQ